MTILSDLRARISGRGASSERAAEGDSAPAGPDQPPIKNYDRLKSRELIDRLSDHTQAELGSIEAYERTHENRHEVIDKLRYMRGSEPFEGYDAMEPAEVVTALEASDRPTIKRARAYEAKFAGRPQIVNAVAELLSSRPANLSQPVAVPPTSYQRTPSPTEPS